MLSFQIPNANWIDLSWLQYTEVCSLECKGAYFLGEAINDFLHFGIKWCSTYNCTFFEIWHKLWCEDTVGSCGLRYITHLSITAKITQMVWQNIIHLHSIYNALQNYWHDNPMITDDLQNFCSGFIGHNMVKYDSRGYSGPMGVTLQSHNTLCNHKVTHTPLKLWEYYLLR